MQPNSNFPTMKNSRSFSFRQIFCAVFLALAGVVLGPDAQAQTSGNWTGAISGNLSLSTNWSPASTVDSTFTGNFNDATYSVAPNATAAVTAMGKLYVGPASGALTFATSTNNITLSGVSGVGIEVASGAGAVNTSTTRFRLAGNQTWLNNSSNSVTIAGNISNNSSSSPVRLTIDGTGNTTISGILSNNTVNGQTSLTKNGTGALTLTGANTFTGGLTLNTGTIFARTNAGALGAGVGTLTLNGGVLHFNHSASLSFSRNTTIGGDVKIVSDKNAAGAGVNYTLGTLSIGANTLTVEGGSNVTSGTAGLIFGATTLTGNAIFNITNPTGGGVTLLTLGAVTNGDYTATLTGNGNFSQTGVWGAGAGGLTLGVSGGTAFTGNASLGGANTFTGGVTINSGTARGTFAAAFGTGTITLGDTTGSNNATLASTLLGSHANNIIVWEGTTGTLSILGGTQNVNFTGSIALNNNLTLDIINGKTLGLNGSITQGANAVTVTKGPAADGLVTIAGATTLGVGGLTLANSGANLFTHSGGITGTGNLTLRNNSTFASGITISTLAVNNTGTITNNGTGTGSVLISGGIGSNVTGITQNSSSSGLSISTTALTVNSTGTTLTSQNGTLSVSGGISGNGNLILKNDGSTANGITVATANHTGTITNSGSGSGSVTLSSIIGTNVTGVTQDSSSSELIISGANTFTSGVTLNTGTITVTAGSQNTLGAGNSTLSINGGVLNLNASGSLSYSRNTTIAGNTKIISNNSTAGAGATYTLGTLSIGANTLTVEGGSNVNSGTAGLTFGATTLTGNTVFNITNPAGGGVALLTLGAVANGANTATLTGNGNFAQSGQWGGELVD